LETKEHVVEDRPEVTVAIPTFNGARHLADALRGILAQTAVAFDLTVCDDRSEDETVEVVRAEAADRARIVINDERLGLAGNWNRCVALSRTPLVAIFHQDDMMLPGHLAAHLSAFKASERLGLVCGAADVVDAEGRPIPESVVERGGLGPSDRTFAPGEALPLLAGGNPLRCSTVTLRAEAHADVGGFDPSYRYVVDWDFWIRVAKRWSVGWQARPTVAIRWHAASETHRLNRGVTDLEETAHLVDELFVREASRWPDAGRLRREADRRLARAYVNRAYATLRSGNATLARQCLLRGVSLRPVIAATIALDPRLAAQMGALAIAPEFARRFFARGDHKAAR
jgi:glycosyltransferase involved in cell wall biosynthesis